MLTEISSNSVALFLCRTIPLKKKKKLSGIGAFNILQMGHYNVSIYLHTDVQHKIDYEFSEYWRA